MFVHVSATNHRRHYREHAQNGIHAGKIAVSQDDVGHCNVLLKYQQTQYVECPREVLFGYSRDPSLADWHDCVHCRHCDDDEQRHVELVRLVGAVDDKNV
jgi:hypothetical protein